MLKILASSAAIRRLAELARDQRGVSAVEFAMLLPLMLTLYLGGVEVSQGVAADRKVTLTARAVADLVAQSTSITDTQMTDIKSAATAVSAPFSSANLKLTVSQVKITDTQGDAVIDWSDASANNTARAVGAPVTLPTALKTCSGPPCYLIWGEVQYSYRPVIGYVVTGTLTLKDQIYMRPRQGNSVCRGNACS